MHYLKKILFILCNLTACCAQSYIYEAKVLRYIDPVSKQKVLFVGLGDFHDKTHVAGTQQLAQFMQLLEKSDRSDIKIVLEDLSSCGSGGRGSCGKFFVNSRGGVLGGLAQKCKVLGFEVDNIEYRYCRVASLGPVLNNLDKKPDVFPSVATTKISMLAQEIDVIAQEISTYEDGDALKTHYKQGLDQIAQQLKNFKAEPHTDMNVAEYLEQNSTAQDRLDFIKHLLTFDSCLLDLKMAHSIMNSNGRTKIVAVAGGAHIARVCELLEKIGYEVVYTTKVDYQKEFDLTKCLGSNIVDGAYCIRPEPINLKRLSKYL